MDYSNYIASLIGGPIMPSNVGGQTAPSYNPPQQWTQKLFQPNYGIIPNQPQSSVSSSGGGGGYSVPDSHLQQLSQIDRNPVQESEYQHLMNEMRNTSDAMKSNINNSWDSYVGQLNEMLNTGLPQQRTAQETQANEAYNQGLNTLNLQKTQQENQLAQTQATNLKDLGSNIQNLFKASNQYLGVKGAADSSASNQMSYAITKLGSKGRGDILSQVSQRQQNLRDVYDSEVRRLESSKTSQAAQIGQWFASAQNQLRQQIGQVGVKKDQDVRNVSQQLYNTALTQMQNVQNQIASQKNALTTWVANNSTSLSQVVSTLKQLGLYTPTPASNQLGISNTSGQMEAPLGYGADKKITGYDIFGRPIYQ